MFIPLRGYQTGRVDRHDSIRHSFAFDLTRADLHALTIVSASLQLWGDWHAGPQSIRLTDPGDEVRYGHGHREPAAELAHVPLSTHAILDLTDASGAYFCIDALMDTGTAGWRPDRVNLLITAESKVANVAAA
jgi:hypothetical protein